MARGLSSGATKASIKRGSGLNGGATESFLSAADVERAAVEVAQIAKAEGASVALAGGCALRLYGSTRMTTDVDFVADRKLRALPAGSPLAFGGVSTHTRSGVPVDLIVRADDYDALYAEALKKAKTVDLGGVKVKVVEPEYLAIMKFLSARPKDLVDLGFLVTEVGLDLPRMFKTTKRLFGQYPVEDLEREIELAQLMAKRERRK